MQRLNTLQQLPTNIRRDRSFRMNDKSLIRRDLKSYNASAFLDLSEGNKLK